MDLTVMTYNIHHGKGMDGKVNLHRIAQVIKQSEAELVALNEVDRNFSSRSYYVDQADWLANELDMNMVFGPSLSLEDHSRQFGNAFLSRHPILSSKNHPISFGHSLIEARSLLEINLSINGKPVKAYVTHLSQLPLAHRKQMNFIIKKISDQSDTILLFGDWNMIPKSRAWNRLTEHVVDVWYTVNQTKGATYPSKRPSLRLDYIFSSPSLPLIKVDVLRTIPIASDHLPLKAIFRLEE